MASKRGNLKKTNIGNGWKEVIDLSAADAKPFYVNKRLKKKQWNWPEDLPRATSQSSSDVRDEDLPPPPPDSDIVSRPHANTDSSIRRGGLANIAASAAKIKVRKEDIEARRRELRKGHMKNTFGQVNVRQIFASDIDGEWDYAFKDFAKGAFDLSRQRKWGFTSSKVDLDTLLRHEKKKLLKRGLLKRSNEIDKGVEAAQMSKNISSYMGDRKSSKVGIAHVYKILRYALDKVDPTKKNLASSGKKKTKKSKAALEVDARESSLCASEILSLTASHTSTNAARGTNTDAKTAYPVLWDELYCQLVKQTTSNESAASLTRGFELLTLCAGSFKCTSGLYPYVMGHLDRAKKGLLDFTDEWKEKNAEALKRVARLARRAQIRLQKTCRMRQRCKVPTQMEITAVLSALPVMIRVYTVEGAYKTLPINTHTTAEDLSKMMALTMGVQDDKLYAIYEQTMDGNRHFLQPHFRIMDVVAIWQEAADEMDETTLQHRGDRLSRLIFMVHYFLEVPETDPVGLSLMYMQSVKNVMNRKYPATRKMCLDLGALQLQEELGNFSGSEDAEMLIGGLHRYMPARFLCDEKNEDTRTRLVERWKRLKDQGYDQFECQMTYIDILKQSPWFGFHKYELKPMLGSDEYPPGGVTLAVSPSSIIVIDRETSDILDTVRIEQIIKHGAGGYSDQWGGALLKLLAGNVVRQHPIRLVAIVPGEAEQIVGLLKAYQRFASRVAAGTTGGENLGV